MSVGRVWLGMELVGSLIWVSLFFRAFTLARALVLRQVYTTQRQRRSRDFGRRSRALSSLRVILCRQDVLKCVGDAMCLQTATSCSLTHRRSLCKHHGVNQGCVL